jgi:hypothetical protein
MTSVERVLGTTSNQACCRASVRFLKIHNCDFKLSNCLVFIYNRGSQKKLITPTLIKPLFLSQFFLENQQVFQCFDITGTGSHSILNILFNEIRYPPNIGLQQRVRCLDFFSLNKLQGKQNPSPTIIHSQQGMEWICLL